jgi:HAD superfamily hydrolase (TIGR01509 family)
MKKVLLFDCDGVLADTERDGHRVAFNQMWRESGVPWQWSVEEYGRKLKIGGGKERMASLFQEPEYLALFRPPETEAERQDLLKKWHQRKTEIYKEIIASGRIAVRSGVKRLSENALSEGWVLGVCSTSAREAVESVLLHTVGEENARRFSLVLAGDVVKAKKPAPDIYVMAADRLQVGPEQCVVIEDSRNGLLSAVAAGMKCVVTINDYTREEDFSEAAIVLTCLGDPGGEKCVVLANRSGVPVHGFFCVAALEKLLASAPRKPPSSAGEAERV